MILSEIVFDSMLRLLGSDVLIDSESIRGIFESQPVTLDGFGNSVFSNDPRLTIKIAVGKKLTGDETVLESGTEYLIQNMRHNDGKKTTILDLIRK